MRWYVQQKMDFISERLRFAGAINRKDLVEAFRISQPQASADLQRFQKLYPNYMRYDSTRKAYVTVESIDRSASRDIGAASYKLARSNDAELRALALHDPSMIRDVAAALVYELNRRPHG
jgi:hypothetical protein